MNGTTRKRRMMSYTGRILAVVLGGLVVFFAADRSSAQGQGAVQQAKAGEQMLFQTPHEAMQALLKALKNDDDQAMIGIFGPKYEKKIPTDRVAKRANRMRAYRAAKEMWTWL